MKQLGTLAWLLSLPLVACASPLEEPVASTSEALHIIPQGPFDPPPSPFTCDATGACRVNGMPTLLQSDLGLPASYDAEASVGCYLTSVMMVSVAALHNRTTSFAPTGDTASLLGLLEVDQPVAVQNTSLVQFEYDSHVNGGYYFFYQLLAELGGIGGANPPGCNPMIPNGDPGLGNGCSEVWGPSGDAEFLGFGGNVPLTSQMFVDGINARSLYVIDFRWETIVPTRLAIGKKTYALGGPHKVATSGTKPGPFPLLVNDPGNQTERGARIGMLSESASVRLPGGAKTWAYIEFEDTPGHYNLIDGYERLRLN